MRKINKKGFTLIEIMIVVVIIGLLAALAIPAFDTVRGQSHQKAILANLRIIGTAASTYMLETGATEVADLDDLRGDYADTAFIDGLDDSRTNMVLDEVYYTAGLNDVSRVAEAYSAALSKTITFAF